MKPVRSLWKPPTASRGIWDNKLVLLGEDIVEPIPGSLATMPRPRDNPSRWGFEPSSAQKRVLSIAFESDKTKLVRRSLSRKVSTDMPTSIFQTHPTDMCSGPECYALVRYN